ncbi:hypothetical protein GNF80_17455 [Clostridium perfringens]|nr:hypothetical protein [Clostridium perfringens]
MNNKNIFFTTIVFILNSLWLYKLLKNRKKLAISSFDVINLNNINDKITNKLIIPILFLNLILILLNLVIEEFLYLWFILYFPFILTLTPIIYISKTNIGTILKCINTGNINFIEITNFENNVKVICNFNDNTSQEIKFRLSIFKNNIIAIEKLTSILKMYGYKVYINLY